ncbi:MAG TPA: hypothetical protein VGY57_09950 [Vicinamibacterales bacterium]|nr:hypothetical protein [Vicinamibacterales bacterium]
MQRIYALATSLALAFSAGAALRQPAPQKPRFDEIDVQRINIVEKDGRVRLVIANADRQAVTVIGGKEILPNRKREAGLIFFNDEGDENGGLTYGGRTENGAARASAGLSFDQYQQDETVTLRYSQTGKDRRAGLTIADRPEASIAAAAALNDAKTDEERAAVRKKLVDAGVLESRQRAFVGKNADGDARLVLSDGDGRPRLALSVTRGGAAKIEFLDAGGKVVRTVTR